MNERTDGRGTRRRPSRTTVFLFAVPPRPFVSSPEFTNFPITSFLSLFLLSFCSVLGATHARVDATQQDRRPHLRSAEGHRRRNERTGLGHLRRRRMTCMARRDGQLR